MRPVKKISLAAAPSFDEAAFTSEDLAELYLPSRLETSDQELPMLRMAERTTAEGFAHRGAAGGAPGGFAQRADLRREEASRPIEIYILVPQVVLTGQRLHERVFDVFNHEHTRERVVPLGPALDGTASGVACVSLTRVPGRVIRQTVGSTRSSIMETALVERLMSTSQTKRRRDRVEHDGVLPLNSKLGHLDRSVRTTERDITITRDVEEQTAEPFIARYGHQFRIDYRSYPRFVEGRTGRVFDVCQEDVDAALAALNDEQMRHFMRRFPHLEKYADMTERVNRSVQRHEHRREIIEAAELIDGDAALEADVRAEAAKANGAAPASPMRSAYQPEREPQEVARAVLEQMNLEGEVMEGTETLRL